MFMGQVFHLHASLQVCTIYTIATVANWGEPEQAPVLSVEHTSHA